MGQSRKLVAATAGPAFPSETDIIGQVRHVPKVPTTDIRTLFDLGPLKAESGIAAFCARSGTANLPNAAPRSELGRRPRQELPVVALLLPVHQDV
jgi:hypothetical protein